MLVDPSPLAVANERPPQQMPKSSPENGLYLGTDSKAPVLGDLESAIKRLGARDVMLVAGPDTASDLHLSASQTSLTDNQHRCGSSGGIPAPPDVRPQEPSTSAPTDSQYWGADGVATDTA